MMNDEYSAFALFNSIAVGKTFVLYSDFQPEPRVPKYSSFIIHHSSFIIHHSFPSLF